MNVCVFGCVFTREFIISSMFVNKIRIARSPQHQFNSIFTNICNFDSLGFVHLLSCFGDLSKGFTSLILWQNEWLKLSSGHRTSQMDWIFLAGLLVFTIWHELKELQILSGKISSPFPIFHEILLCWRCPPWCNALWVTGDAISVLPANF